MNRAVWIAASVVVGLALGLVGTWAVVGAQASNERQALVKEQAVAFELRQTEFASLQEKHQAAQGELATLQREQESLAAEVARMRLNLTGEEVLSDALRQQVQSSIGDRVVLTEGAYTALPKTIAAAEAQGYLPMDTLAEDGTVTEAHCFMHGDALHYGRPDPKMTDGVEWHGATVIPIYGRESKQLMGIVLESVTPQPSPPWEHHPEGHPGMDFPHWSLHIWFTDPPDNLSLAHS